MFEDNKKSMASGHGRSWDSIRNKLVENSIKQDTVNNKLHMNESTFFNRVVTEIYPSPATTSVA